MSLGSLSLLPPELIRHICYDLSLDDVIKLQRCHPTLEALIDNVFFLDMKRMEVNWEAQGASITLLAPSISKRTFVTTTSSDIWKNVIYKSEMIEQVIITKSEDAKDFTILDYISKSEYRIRQLDIILRAGELPVSPMKRNQSYRKLTSFMSVNRKWLQEFRLETDPDNIIEFIVKNQDAVLRYAHDNDSMLQQTLIVPIFHAMMSGRRCTPTLTLKIEWREKPDMALQAAFHAALPREHRAQLQVLRLDFGFNVSTLSHAEIQQVLSQYAPYLNDTRNLQHLILDLSHSTLDPCQLEKLYYTISQELPNTHRISLYTSECLPKNDIELKQKQMNRVACS